MLDLIVVILTYNTKRLTINCLKSIFEHRWKHKIGVWLVDNASTDGTCEAVEKLFPYIKVLINKSNLGFSKGNNLVIRKVYKNTKYILLLNSDTKILPGSLDDLINYAETNEFDIVSAKLVSPNGDFQPNAGELPYFLPTLLWLSGIDDVLRKVVSVPSYQQRDIRFYKEGKEVGWVSGSLMLIKTNVFEKIGFLDDKIFMYGEDVDFCWRAKKAGFKVGWTNSSSIIHIGGASSKEPKFAQWRGEFLGLLYLYKKHYGATTSAILKIFMYLFIFLRSIAFLFIGKREYARNYLKIITAI